MEGDEEAGELISRQARSGVNDLEFQERRRSCMNDPGDNANETGVRELDGVEDEVEEDLSEADGVGVHGFGDGAIAGDGEVEVVGQGFGGGDLPDLHHDAMGGTRGDVDGDAAAHKAGHIEGVVDEAEDVVGAGLDALEGGFARSGVRWCRGNGSG